MISRLSASRTAMTFAASAVSTSSGLRTTMTKEAAIRMYSSCYARSSSSLLSTTRMIVDGRCHVNNYNDNYCTGTSAGNSTNIRTTKRSMSIDAHKKTGAGYGNVRDRVIPASREVQKKLFRHSDEPKTCSIIGAPMTYGQPFVGTDCGPALLRESGLRSMLTALNWRVEDIPDLDFEAAISRAIQPVPLDYTGNAKNANYVGPSAGLVADIVYEKLQKGRFPLILGGDHSIGIGSLAAILHHQPDTGVLWIDAHADINTPEISESGNMHGMPIGILMDGLTPPVQPIPGFEWLQTKFTTRLQPQSIVYVGLRDVDPEERRIIHDLNITAYTMHEIDQYGIGKVMEMALDHLCKDNMNRPLHLSYDIDAVDPVLAPATGTTVRGGLTFREAHYVAETAAQSGNLASAEIVELNPSLSHDEGAEETVELGLQIITSLMGKSII